MGNRGVPVARVPAMGWDDILAAARPKTAPLDDIRPAAFVVLGAAVLEAVAGTHLARTAERIASEPTGPNHFGATAGYRWVTLHGAQMSASGLTVVHTGGEIWCPIAAAVAAVLLLVAAPLTRGWREGRSWTTAMVAVGIVGGGLAVLPLAFAVAVGVLSVFGYVLWTLLVAIIFALIGIAMAAFVGLLLWAWAQS